LGYEWSAAKGNEGIKLSTDAAGKHHTPLYDEDNPRNPNKINYYIEKAFLAEPIESIPETLQAYLSTARLVDMLDFTRTDFNKQFSLTPKNTYKVETQWSIKKLSDLIEIIGGGTPDTKNASYWNGDILWLSVVDFNSDERYVHTTEKTITEDGLRNSSTKYLQTNDLIISARGTVGALAQLSKPMTFNQSCYGLRAKNFITNDFLYYVLKQEIEQFKLNAYGSKFDAITTRTFDDIQIPVPPINIQQKIVQECEVVDDDTSKAHLEIEAAKKSISALINNSFEKGYDEKKLNSLCSMQAGRFVAASDIKDNKENDSYPCYGGNGLRGYTKTFTHEGTFSLIGRQGALCGNVKKVSGKFHATEHAVVVNPNSDIDIDWLYYQLKALNLNQYATGVAQPGLSVQKLLTVTTPVPPLDEQKRLVAKINTLETAIQAARAVIDSAAAKKAAIVKKYL
jgi:restriction endonuclease S subunit